MIVVASRGDRDANREILHIFDRYVALQCDPTVDPRHSFPSVHQRPYVETHCYASLGIAASLSARRIRPKGACRSCFGKNQLQHAAIDRAGAGVLRAGFTDIQHTDLMFDQGGVVIHIPE